MIADQIRSTFWRPGSARHPEHSITVLNRCHVALARDSSRSSDCQREARDPQAAARGSEMREVGRPERRRLPVTAFVAVKHCRQVTAVALVFADKSVRRSCSPRTRRSANGVRSSPMRSWRPLFSIGCSSAPLGHCQRRRNVAQLQRHLRHVVVAKPFFERLAPRGEVGSWHATPSGNVPGDKELGHSPASRSSGCHRLSRSTVCVPPSLGPVAPQARVRPPCCAGAHRR